MVRVAIVKLSALGDIVHAMVVLQLIKKHLPDIEIDWIVEEGLAGVLEHNPDIDQILPVRLKALKKSPSLLFEEIRKIRAYARSEYDVVIDLQGLIKSALLSRMLGESAGFDRNSIREKAASFLYRKTFPAPYEMNVIERNMVLVKAALDLDISPEALREKKPFLFYEVFDLEKSTSFLSRSQNNIVYILGSSWKSKIYPAERLAEVIERVGGNALLVWGNEEEGSMADLLSKKSTAIKLPRLSLGELKALISQADLVIGGDSGPTHFAWALNRPSITLFGPTPAERNTLEGPLNRTISSSSRVDPMRLNRNDFSISEIDPGEIAELARELLEGSDASDGGKRMEGSDE